MAIMTNITYSDMAKLQIKVSTHNIGVESRKMIIKSFEESKTQTSGSNFTETIWADIWEPSMLEAAHEVISLTMQGCPDSSLLCVRTSDPSVSLSQAPFGVRQPFEQSFHKFSRGNGRRSSRGGSKGLWTLEVDTENPSLSEDLPELEGWTLYLCRQGETLQSTPDIKEVLEDIDDNLPKVRSFSGAYRYNPFAGAGAANGLVQPSFASRMRTVRRGVAAWMVGTWLWKKWQGNLGSKHSHIVTFVEHLAEHKKKKSIMMHFDPVENTD